MKTMMKQGVVFAAVLLVATMLVTGCMPEPGTEPGYKPPTGMGAVQINLSLDNPNARKTIMPETATINTFAQFHLNFVPITGGAAWDDYYTLNASDRIDPINLAPGTYTLEVIAYMDDIAVPVLAAAVGKADFTVTGGATNYGVPVTLYAYDPDEGDENGTFAWKIGITGLTIVLSEATMTVDPIGTGTTYGSYDLLDGTAPNAWVNLDGVSVLEGYYYVNFSLTSSGVTRTFRHVLHIYRGHTSTFEYEFDNDKLGIVATTVVVTPTYEHPQDNSPELLSGVTPVAAGATISISSSNTTAVLSIDNDADYTAYSWFCDGDERNDTATYTVTYGTAPFDAGLGTYSLTVTGFVTAAKAAELNTFEGAPFSTEIFIKVE